MWPFKKKTEEKLSYRDEHNKAYAAYKKASQIGIWAGALNVLGLLIAIAQLSEMKFLNLFLCFGSTNFIVDLLMLSAIASTPWFYIISFVFAIIISTGFILLSVFASQGKRLPLIISIIIYFVDMCFVFPLGLMGLENVGTLWLNIGVHMLILVFMGIALYQHHRIVQIAIKHGILKEGE